MTLSHRERLQACLANDASLDRPPVALWRHFPVDDQQPESLARATLDFQRWYDFDLVKVTPASSFSIRDWGVEDVWEGNPEGTRRYTRHAIERPQDWERLPELTPSSTHLARQRACLRLIRHGLPAETPLLQTVFSPLAQAKNLAGGDRLLTHLRQTPEAVLRGLETIACTTHRFVQACADEGIDGIFYAVQHAQAGLLSLDEYQKLALSFDQQILEAAGSLWCNILHLHGSQVHFELAGLLPCQVVNWHDRETSPTLEGGLERFRGTVCGGISQKTIVLGEQSAVEQEAADALRQTAGHRFILGTGCVVPIIAPLGNIYTARRMVEVGR
jgi:uroporphyrinogen decarboxylase